MKKWIYLTLATLSFSNNAISRDCKELLEGSTAASACFAAESAKETDKELNESYNLLMRAFEKYGYPKDKLVNAERAWIKYRDEQCELENVTFGGIESVSWARCMDELTGERLGKINDLLEAFDTRGLQ